MTLGMRLRNVDAERTITVAQAQELAYAVIEDYVKVRLHEDAINEFDRLLLEEIDR